MGPFTPRQQDARSARYSKRPRETTGGKASSGGWSVATSTHEDQKKCGEHSRSSVRTERLPVKSGKSSMAEPHLNRSSRALGAVVSQQNSGEANRSREGERNVGKAAAEDLGPP
jgi:hypothetical protein